MKGYLSLFKMRLIAGMQYRAAAWAGVATQFFFGFMHLMVLFAFYRSSTAKQPMSYSEIASYVWLTQAFLAIIMLWWQDSEIFSLITNGNVAYELCRPYGLYQFWFVRLLSARLANVSMRCFPILILTFFLPAPYKMTPPPSFAAFFLFLVSLALSLIIVISVSMLIYVLTFITMSPTGSRLLIGIASEFLAGSVLPIPLMPEGMQKVLSFFPFRYTQDLPLRTFSGSISPTEALSGIGIQLLWILILTAFGYLSMTSVLRKTVVQGG